MRLKKIQCTKEKRRNSPAICLVSWVGPNSAKPHVLGPCCYVCKTGPGSKRGQRPLNSQDLSSGSSLAYSEVPWIPKVCSLISLAQKDGAQKSGVQISLHISFLTP